MERVEHGHASLEEEGESGLGEAKGEQGRRQCGKRNPDASPTA
jgi:hypothetical protein